MFDDFLSAVALTGIAGLLAVAASTGVSETVRPLRDTTSLQATEVATTADAAATTERHAGANAGPMPIHELPRVVIVGQRTRSGEVLARGAAPAAAPDSGNGAPMVASR